MKGEIAAMLVLAALGAWSATRPVAAAASLTRAPTQPGHTVLVRPQVRPSRAPAREAPKAIARETGFARASDGTRIYYEKLGDGPAIALIHGLGGNHAVWYPVVPTLARDHTVIVLAQRGFAPSEGARDKFDVQVLMSDFIAVLDAAGVDRATVVGQSMGGWTALAATLQHPERISALVLSDSIGGIFDDEIRAQYATTLERARRLGSKPPPLSMHPALDPAFSREHPAEGYLYQLLTTFGAPSPGIIAQQLGSAEVPHDALQKMALPVLFMVGEKDEIFPSLIIRRAASYVPRARVVELPRTGHSAYFEQPEEWEAGLLEFMRGVERGADSTSP